MASKEIDRWLKSEIEKVPEKLIKFRDNKLESKMVYYTGNWQISGSDVLDLPFECLFSRSVCLYRKTLPS